MTRIVSILLLLCSASWACAEEPRGKELKLETFRGKVVPLADLLKKQGVELDPDAAATWFALQTDDGKLYPLVKDNISRLFFTDKAMLNRPMQLEGRILPGTQFLQAVKVLSLKDGKPHEVYYWCEICAIRRLSLEKSGVCECCGGQMDRRELPVGK